MQTLAKGLVVAGVFNQLAIKRLFEPMYN